MPASASPHVVPLPFSVEAAVDPEEAFVASASSCHMLWFLALAAKAGFVVDAYEDAAEGVLGRDGAGREAIVRITLRPRVEFAGDAPAADRIHALHEEAHARCFIANSIRSELVVEPREPVGRAP